jgi:PAS domain S-box-containing protein/diguanylate cyclase (GGDEF)-like protein
MLNELSPKPYSLKEIEIILDRIYECIFQFKSIEEILKDIHMHLNNYSDFVFIWTAIFNKNLSFIKLISFSDNFDFRFDQVEYDLNHHIDIEKLKQTSIYVNNNIEETNNYFSANLKKTLKQKQIKSYLILRTPINHEESILICLFTQKSDYFINAFFDRFYSFQRNLSILMKFFENYKHSFNLFSAIELGKIWLLITDENGIIEYVSPYVSKISGYSSIELIGKKTSIFKSGIQPEIFYKTLWDKIKNHQPFTSVFVNKNKQGELFFIKQFIIPIETYDNKTKFISIGFEIDKDKTLETLEIDFFDPLTNLPSESIFLNYLTNFINNNKDKAFACILLDIQNFTDLNVFFDKDFANLILKEFSKNLMNHFNQKQNAVISRIRSDEFGIFIQIPDEHKENPKHWLQEVFYSLNKKVQIHHLEFYLNFHCGVSIYPNDSKNANSIYQLAQLSLKKSKTENIKNIEFYQKSLEEKSKFSLLIQQKHDYSNFENEFYLVFQPYYRIQDLKISGYEVLSRWNDKQYGNISPIQFIPLLEKSGLIKSFEISLIKHFLKTYKGKLFIAKDKTFSINLSTVSFNDDYLVDQILQIFLDSQLDLSRFTIELTESSYIESFEYAKQTIKKVKDIGLKISIDDFGTGYSSLRYIMDLDVDYIKIDKIFIQNYQEKRSSTIIKTIYNLSEQLGLKTIAEGIETQEQLEFLRNINIDYCQGFLLSKPLPIEEMILTT